MGREMMAATVIGFLFLLLPGRLVSCAQTDILPRDIEPNKFLCQNLSPGLTKWQRDRCERNIHTYAAAIQGIRRAAYECKQRFRYEQWDCPDLFDQLQKHLQDEKSVFSFACQKGMIPTEQCISDTPDGYDIQQPTAAQYRKLHENIKNGVKVAPLNLQTQYACFDKCQNLGRKISEEFLLEDAGYEDVFSNLQEIAQSNQKRGRSIVTQQQKIKEKCHGLSGTCMIKTRIPTLASYEDVAGKVFREYSTAREYGHCNERDACQKYVNELIYTDQEPDYCSASENAQIGFMGMQGRQCRLTPRQLSRNKKRKDKETSRKHKKRQGSRKRAKDNSERRRKNRPRREKNRDKNRDRESRREKQRERKRKTPKMKKCGKQVGQSSKRKENDFCCNQGYKEVHRSDPYKCKCVFHWCCHVQCEECHRNTTIGVCN